MKKGQVSPLSVKLVLPEPSSFPVSWSESTHVGLFLNFLDQSESRSIAGVIFKESPDLARATAILERIWQNCEDLSEARIFCNCLSGFENDLETIARIQGCVVVGNAGEWCEVLELGVTSSQSLIDVVLAIWSQCAEFTICFGVNLADTSPFDLEARRFSWKGQVPPDSVGVFTMCYGHPDLALAVLPRSPSVPWLEIIAQELEG